MSTTVDVVNGTDWAAVAAAIATAIAAIGGIWGTSRQARNARQSATADLKASLEAAASNIQKGINAEDRRAKQLRSADRRFEAYSDFLTKARSFRNAIRGYDEQPDPAFGPKEIDAIARSAHAASALVFLVVESKATYDLGRAIVRTISDAQGFLPNFGSRSKDDPWPKLNDRMARLLREFQVAAREELEIGGVDRSWMLDRNRPRDL